MVMYDDPKWIRQFKALQVMWEGLIDSVGYGFFVEHSDSAKSEFPEVSGFHCSQPFQRMFLKCNGNVTICCYDSADELITGNWKKESLYDIWNGETYKSIRKVHREGRYYKMDICRKCYFPVSKKRDPEGKIT